MKIVVPDDIGGELRILPEETFESTITDIFLGTSAAKQPKLTFKHVLTSESPSLKDGDPPCLGEIVLDTYSLQPQALFRLNTDFKKVTGSKIPASDSPDGYDAEEFLLLMKETFMGTNWTIALETETNPNDGEERTKIKEKMIQVRKGKAKKR
jgi:hypothetical protein